MNKIYDENQRQKEIYGYILVGSKEEKIFKEYKWIFIKHGSNKIKKSPSTIFDHNTRRKQILNDNSPPETKKTKFFRDTESFIKVWLQIQHNHTCMQYDLRSQTKQNRN